MGHVVSLEERDDMALWDGSKGKGTSLTIQANAVLEGAYLGYVLRHGDSQCHRVVLAEVVYCGDSA